jgi:hypothetical protein
LIALPDDERCAASSFGIVDRHAHGPACDRKPVRAARQGLQFPSLAVASIAFRKSDGIAVSSLLLVLVVDGVDAKSSDRQSVVLVTKGLVGLLDAIP